MPAVPFSPAAMGAYAFGEALEKVRSLHAQSVEDLRTEIAWLRERLNDEDPITPKYDEFLQSPEEGDRLWKPQVAKSPRDVPLTPRDYSVPAWSPRLSGTREQLEPPQDQPEPQWDTGAQPDTPRHEPDIAPGTPRDELEASVELCVEKASVETCVGNQGQLASEDGDLKRNESLMESLTHGREATHRALSAWKLEAEEALPHGRKDRAVWRFVHSSVFEGLSVFFVLFGGLVTALELQYVGLDVGYGLSIDGYDKPAKDYDHWRLGPPFFKVTHVCLPIIYFSEIVLRIIADPRAALCSRWFFFDCIVLLFFLLLVTAGIGLNPITLRVSHVVRLCRWFEEGPVRGLHMLCKTFAGSFVTLCWVFFALVLLQVAVVIVLNQPLYKFMEDNNNDPIVKAAVFKHFGTFARSMFTMFEISFGNWVVPSRLLFEDVNEWFGGVCILWRCFFMFGLISISAAVFVTEANRFASQDEKIAIRRKQAEKAKFLKRLKTMFADLDSSGDGFLSFDEFKQLMHDPDLAARASILEINAHEVDSLFRYLDEGHGKISYEKLVKGLENLKHRASLLEYHTMHKSVLEISEKVHHLHESLATTKPRDRIS